MTSLRDGLDRVMRAPVIFAGAAVLTLALAWPIGQLVSAAAEPNVAVAANWWRHCVSPATDTDPSLETALVGCAAVLASAPMHPDDVSDGVPVVLVGYLLAGFLLLWTFLSAGILDRYARLRPTRSAGFFAACGLYGSRLVRLSLGAALTYALLFGLFGVVGNWNWGLGGPETAGGAGGAGSGLPAIMATATRIGFALTLAAVALVFDYARVRAVVEDRRSMTGALLAAWRFVRRRPGGCLGLYAANGVILVGLLSVQELAGPFVSPAGWITWVTGAGHIAVCLAGRLFFYATEIAYFQSQLAHAGYVAAPAPVWPESPSAEALGRLG